VVALDGVDATGTLEHVRDSVSYAEARSLAMNLAPGVTFPEVPVVGMGEGRMMNDGRRAAAWDRPPTRTRPRWVGLPNPRIARKGAAGRSARSVSGREFNPALRRDF